MYAGKWLLCLRNHAQTRWFYVYLGYLTGQQDKTVVFLVLGWR